MLDVLEVKVPIYDRELEKIQKFVDYKNSLLEKGDKPWTIETAVYVLMMRGVDDFLRDRRINSAQNKDTTPKPFPRQRRNHRSYGGVAVVVQI